MGDISKYFNRSEFACKDKCGLDTVDVELITILEDLREHFGNPVRVNSSCRCSKYNNIIRGAKKSKHYCVERADVTVDNISPFTIWKYLVFKYKGKYGIGRYENFTHIDTRNGCGRW